MGAVRPETVRRNGQVVAIQPLQFLIFPIFLFHYSRYLERRGRSS
jgi:hypothetical protein